MWISKRTYYRLENNSNEFKAPYERMTVIQVVVNGMFLHNVFGMSATFPALSRRCIQKGKATRRARLIESRVAVVAERMLERSALRMLNLS
jgi:hypothetical protein